MRYTTGTLSDLTLALNEAIAELSAPVNPADGTLASAVTQLNLLIDWTGKPVAHATGTLNNAETQYNALAAYYIFAEVYYIIPMVAGPYSRTNPQRPMYVDDIQCNWTGHNVDELSVYACLVNTSDAKHTLLESNPGVFSLPRIYGWDTVISTMTAQVRNKISNWLSDAGIPYDSSETMGQLYQRVINTSLYSLGSTPLDTQYQNLTQAQKDKITALADKWGNARPTATETVRQITNRTGDSHWPGKDRGMVFVDPF